jgi:hypothetical protein
MIKSVAFAAFALFAAADPAAAQSTAPPKDETRERPATKGPALNLRLDDASRGAPRVTFGSPDSTTKETAKGLPELGGKPSNLFDRPMNPAASGSPFPKDTNPNH